MAYRDSVIALFSGAGGLSLGFSQAGLKPVIAADITKDACETYQSNLGIDPFNIDLSEENEVFDKLLDEIHEPLAIIGGPPCQGFSSAGNKNGKDNRNGLIFHYLSIVERTRPRWFLFENVEGLLTSNGGKSVAELVTEFIKIGYRVRLEKVNFAAYGLPQARKRVILMGNRIDLNFTLPTPTHSYNAGKHKSSNTLPLSPTLDETLAGLGKVVKNIKEISPYSTPHPKNEYDALMRNGNNSGGVFLHFSSISQSVEDVVAKLCPGQTMKDLPVELWHESFRERAFRRVMDGMPSDRRGGAPSGIKRLFGNLNALTITSAAPREFIHPYEDRPLTLREAARLQSFPDYYRFVGNSTSIAQQIGNAFPPMVAEIFAKHMLILDGLSGTDQSMASGQTKGALIGYRLTDANGMSPALAHTDALLKAIQGGQIALPLEASYRSTHDTTTTRPKIDTGTIQETL